MSSKETTALPESLNETLEFFQPKLEIFGESIDPLEVFQSFCDQIDGVRWERGEISEGKNFTIEVEKTTEKFPRGGEWVLREPKDEERKEARKDGKDPNDPWGRPDKKAANLIGAKEKELPVSTLVITVGKDFSYRDIPALIREMQKVHNEFAKENQNVEKEKLEFASGFFLQICEKIAMNYNFWAKKIEDFAKDKDLPEMKEYAEWCRIIARDFAPDSLGVKVGQWLEDTAGPTAKEKWNKILENYQKRFMAKAKKNNLSESKLKEKESRKNTYALNRLASLTLKKELTDDLKKMIFARGEAELWRLSDVPEVFKENFSPDKRTRKSWFNGKSCSDEEFPAEWRSLKDAQEALKTANTPEKKAEIQINIAKILNKILYLEKFFAYKDGVYSLRATSRQKLVNCMTQSQILHLIWREMFGEETIGVSIHGHFFSALQLANGQVLSLDGIPKIVDLKIEEEIQEYNNSWAILGPHEKMYRAGIWDWQVSYYKEKEKYAKAIFCYQKAIELNPKDPVYYANLGNVFRKIEKFPEAEAAYKKAVELSKKVNAWYLTSLADFYDSGYFSKCPALLPNHKEAIRYYKLALSAMEQGSKNWVSKEKIEKRIKKLKFTQIYSLLTEERGGGFYVD